MIRMCDRGIFECGVAEWVGSGFLPLRLGLAVRSGVLP
jgi:hypothetical protein